MARESATAASRAMPASFLLGHALKQRKMLSHVSPDSLCSAASWGLKLARIPRLHLVLAGGSWSPPSAAVIHPLPSLPLAAIFEGSILNSYYSPFPPTAPCLKESRTFPLCLLSAASGLWFSGCPRRVRALGDCQRGDHLHRPSSWPQEDDCDHPAPFSLSQSSVLDRKFQDRVSGSFP